MSQRYIGGLIYNPPGGFSGYFDGSGDYLSTPSNTAFALGTGDFTIEAWVNPSTRNAANTICGTRISTNNSTTAFTCGYDSSGSAFWYTNGYVVQSSNDAVPVGIWTHIAFVKASGTLTVYVNGISRSSASFSQNMTDQVMYVGAAADGLQLVTGYMSNLRIVKGTAVYTAAFTPPNGPLQAITNTSLLTCAYPTFRDGSSNNFTITVNGNTAVSTQNPFPQTQLPVPALGNQGNGVYSMSQYQALKQQNLWPAIDQYWPYVTLMLHGNGTNGAQNNTFLDSSTNNFTITRNGNTTQGTFTPYGSNWSNYFDGTGDYLSLTGTALGSGNFTVECWFNMPSWSTSNYPVIGSASSGTTAGWELYLNGPGSNIRLWSGGGDVISSSTTIQKGVWYHLALVRSGSTATLYINGVNTGSATFTSNLTNTTMYVSYDQYAQTMTGYVSNVRHVVGTAVYTSAFTPPTAPLTAITNTSLLTCQSNRFVDNSANNFAITVNGDTSVQRFSPFAPTTPYAAGTIGGSGYFDGSGDYLTTPASSQFNPAGDFTIGLWFYPNSALTINQNLIGNLTANVSTDWLIQMVSGTLSIYTNGTTVRISSATAVVPFQWNYISVTRSSNVISAHVNGSSIGTYSQSGSFGTASKAIEIGNATNNVNGYISGIFLRDGTADTTVPAAPRTNVSGTSLLLNFTNGGIIDNAMMNDLETVGNAQISTTQSKFGGASLYLDGSGDYLVSAATNLPFTFNTGDFTIECWLYPASVSGGTITIVSNRFDAGADTVLIFAFGTTNGLFFHTQATAVLNSGTNLTANTWQHVALCRAGGTVRIFLNGVQVGSSVSSAQNLSATASVFVGQDGTKGAGAAAQYNGYIDDLRITKGYARYTANFTPQRSQWQDQ